MLVVVGGVVIVVEVVVVLVVPVLIIHQMFNLCFVNEHIERLKYGSEEKGSSLYKCSILLALFCQKT